MKLSAPKANFILMMTLLSCFTFNTKILKILKDTLVVSNPNLGAQLIPFLKTWALIPFTILAIYLFNWLSVRYSPLRVFQVITGVFTTFFAAFYLFLWPYHPGVIPQDVLKYIYQVLPSGLQSLGLMIEYWPISLFYVMADTWSILFISLIFWNIISQIVSSESAKDIYPWFSLDISAMIIGLISGLFILAENTVIPETGSAWSFKFSSYMLLLILVCFLQLYVFWKLVRKVRLPHLPRKGKDDFQLSEKLQLIRSPFFIGIAVTVFLMEFTDALFDTIWKDVLGKAYPDPGDFSDYLSWVTAINGVLVTFTVFFISRRLLKKYSWTRVAILTPICLTLTSSLFFTCLFYRNFSATIGHFFSVRPEAVVAFAGAIQACIMQLAKTTFFDNTRELAFLSCSLQERRLGKSFADAFATRMGKSTASITQQSLLFMFIMLSATYSYLAMLILLSIPLWIYSTCVIGSQLKNKTQSA
ncbi:Npt1/Npt2 family nucleotide transporter [Algicola sagamiensis]|uniref:Npt1/Npt2 family nucleotide transporter n=1 Tax=Algicola sagamiensis TaxID=163869 RepID=UPI000361FB5A|nr:Npt1/Npt2 family nucleotide transporter [Algicola sagamiensis]